MKKILCFNRAQVSCIQVVAKLHLLRPISTYGIYHPITDRLECIEHEYEASGAIDKIMRIIFRILLDNEAKGRIDRLLECGYIMPYPLDSK